ncbi:hypothetical protein AMTR_s00082p00119610 [Amborella trichopoda]|uniref:Uncharacterized protein n=1 Tax=Amborella trichopoda TaxID=13333 RepID=W1NSS7_AMBTC|nr:hypothetical protein AMTR_s00082p00119610 [Amborella trichopoda]
MGGESAVEEKVREERKVEGCWWSLRKVAGCWSEVEQRQECEACGQQRREGASDGCDCWLQLLRRRLGGWLHS